MRVLSKGFLLLAVLLPACGGFEVPSQPQAGEGWEFLAWAPTDYIAPGGATVLTTQEELDDLADSLRSNFATQADLDRVSEARTPSLRVNFESEVVLALSSTATGECGGPIYLEISFTESQIVVMPFLVPKGKTCTSDAQQSVSLFAIEREFLPDNPFGIVVGTKPESTVSVAE